MQAVFFDATVDLETPEFESVLAEALAQLGPSETYGVHIPADGDGCELGELVSANAVFTRPITQGCWVVTGQSAGELTTKLRDLL